MDSFDRIADALEAFLEKQGQYDPSLLAIPFISALLGALTSAVLFHHLALRREARQKKLERTQSLIDDFFSKEFISHRASLYKTSEKVVSKQTTPRKIAAGFVNPIEEEDFSGDELDGLTEHEHLTLYLGYLERVAYDLSEELVDIKALRKALSYEVSWHADLLRAVAEQAREIAKVQNVGVPSFCGSTNLVLDRVESKGAA